MSRLLKQSVAVRSASSRWDTTQRWVQRRRWWLAGVGTIAVGLLVWGLWPASAHRYTPDPRSRQFSSFTVCVLTGSGGVGGGQAAEVWAGVEDASKATRVQGSYLAVPPPDTPGAAEVYVDTLASRHCSLVVATGASEAAAVGERAAVYSSQRYVVVGSGRSAANVQVIPGGTSTVRAAVAAAVERAAVGRFG